MSHLNSVQELDARFFELETTLRKNIQTIVESLFKNVAFDQKSFETLSNKINLIEKRFYEFESLATKIQEVTSKIPIIEDKIHDQSLESTKIKQANNIIQIDINSLKVQRSAEQANILEIQNTYEHRVTALYDYVHKISEALHNPSFSIAQPLITLDIISDQIQKDTVEQFNQMNIQLNELKSKIQLAFETVGKANSLMKVVENNVKDKSEERELEMKINHIKSDLEGFKSEILYIAKLNTEINKKLQDKDKIVSAKIYKIVSSLIFEIFKHNKKKFDIMCQEEKKLLLSFSSAFEADTDSFSNIIDGIINSRKYYNQFFDSVLCNKNFNIAGIIIKKILQKKVSQLTKQIIFLLLYSNLPHFFSFFLAKPLSFNIPPSTFYQCQNLFHFSI